MAMLNRTYFSNLIKWLYPGMRVKRWLFIAALGIVFISFGLLVAADLIFLHLLNFSILARILSLMGISFPALFTALLLVLAGSILFLLGIRKTLNTVGETLSKDNTVEMVDILYKQRLRRKGPRIVALGGGTGLSTLLRGLKHYSQNITAIVTVSDDGGSSGRLRKEMGIIPLGDIRNCIAALSNEERLLTELFQYRFDQGKELEGHSFGNLFLTAMTGVTGNVDKAIKESAEVLAIQGKVLPATSEMVTLEAQMEDGSKVVGESAITTYGSRIKELSLSPHHPRVSGEVIQSILEADLIVFGPGSLFTSILPHLLLPEIVRALNDSKAYKIYVCNVMTQPGETDDFRVSDHVRTIFQYAKLKVFDQVLLNTSIPRKNLEKYISQGSYPVEVDYHNLSALGINWHTADLLDESFLVRHDSHKLAKAIFSLFGKNNPF